MDPTEARPAPATHSCRHSLGRGLLMALALAVPAAAIASEPCNTGYVFEDRMPGNGQVVDGPGIPNVKVSDGVHIVTTDADGRYELSAVDGRTTFVIKPPGYTVPEHENGLPDYWRNLRTQPGPSVRYGGIPTADAACRNFPLVPAAAGDDELQVLVFADPQVKSEVDVDYYHRDIIQPLLEQGAQADLGLTLGDVVDDDLSLYPALNAHTASLGVPWLHVAGNHDMDLDAGRDDDALLSFRHVFGPDTFAWEEQQATFLLLDDVIHQPGQSPAYIGGFREEQFRFLEAYLPTVPVERLLVVALHIPLFEPDGRDTFRDADRERLFGMLSRFPNVLLLSAHNHTQQHVFHDATSGWQGSEPLHEFNVGAVCGAFWSGLEDAAGIPDATMADGTPNGFARLRVGAGGQYALSWHPARLPAGDPALTEAMALHAPRVLRRGAYPAWGVYANVFMGMHDSRVEFRIDDGAWKPMRRIERPDPRLLAENVRDDEATGLRGFDRSPEAQSGQHLWRGALPTDLDAGMHHVEVRVFDPWIGEQRAATTYELQDAAE